ncbi:TNF receptor-associated factor 2-like isoform X2 [Mercenaria mercenaria]|uniref:TNF receptor-associated factor 2-like isoform X2 n=1 Tax=Mercenaria mercenaria TaxID=6596 RepID=UPI00234F7A01|nr:TNF receptor-associated factor 2-like isoform X2 [Mercenaria mercenaria]
MAASNQAVYLMEGGYPKEIFRNGTFDLKYLCNFCNAILREPVQSFCGHRFCKSCMEANISSGEQIKCTQCEKEDVESGDASIISPDQIFPDNAIKREMSKLKVDCANANCKWSGSFRQYEEHYHFCEFKKVQCPSCGLSILQKDMGLNQHQQSECQTQKIKCPVGCGEIERKNYYEHYHQKKHDVWVVQEIGKINATLKELHTSDSRLQQHVSESTAVTTQMNEKLAVLERQVQGLHNQQSESGNVTAISGVPNIDMKIRQAIELQLQSVNERLDVKTGTFEGIASALHRELEKTITAVEKLERHRREMETQIEQNQNKIRSLERSLALKDMTMAELELKAQSMEAASYDGTFMWRVHDFNKKHQDALHGRTISIYSPPFYTTRRGYKMCARLYPNGDGMGKGSHLSLFFVVMRGNYDALLKWPFSQRVTFCMINQTGGEHVIDSFRPDPQSSSFKRPTSDMNIASGCPLFIRLEMLQNPNHGFLKDDTLFLKIAVDTSDLTDPVSNFEDRIKPVQA